MRSGAWGSVCKGLAWLDLSLLPPSQLPASARLARVQVRDSVRQMAQQDAVAAQLAEAHAHCLPAAGTSISSSGPADEATAGSSSSSGAGAGGRREASGAEAGAVQAAGQEAGAGAGSRSPASWLGALLQPPDTGGAVEARVRDMPSDRC